MLLIIFALTVVIFFTIYFNLKHHFIYFKRHNVNHVEPTLILGSIRDLVLMRKNPIQWLDSLYHSNKAKHQPYIGFFAFHKPGLLVREPELIKQVLIKDVQHFTNRQDSLDGNNHLLHSILYSKFYPLLTSKTMSKMFTLFDEVSS